ncbi:hypothetical protein GF340_06030 [Candidatus Peregrinibacteria bacterium]|nr:hypothetical protein [Candidatus Peregrinibacteria bacterium]
MVEKLNKPESGVERHESEQDSKVNELAVMIEVKSLINIEKVREAYKFLCGYYEDKSKASFKIGEILLEMGRLNEALNYYSAAKERGNTLACARMGMIFADIGLYDEAVIFFNEALNDPANERFVTDLIDVYKILEDYKGLLTAIEYAIQHGHRELLKDFAYYSFKNGQLDEAIDSYMLFIITFGLEAMDKMDYAHFLEFLINCNKRIYVGEKFSNFGLDLPEMDLTKTELIENWQRIVKGELYS